MSQAKHFYVLDQSRYTNMVIKMGIPRCVNCRKELSMGDKVATRTTVQSSRFRVWCEDCAKRLLII